jgi:8-oxo-dGTP pyrophosphatase MutT (NUDIX family)
VADPSNPTAPDQFDNLAASISAEIDSQQTSAGRDSALARSEAARKAWVTRRGGTPGGGGDPEAAARSKIQFEQAQQDRATRLADQQKARERAVKMARMAVPPAKGNIPNPARFAALSKLVESGDATPDETADWAFEGALAGLVDPDKAAATLDGDARKRFQDQWAKATAPDPASQQLLDASHKGGFLTAAQKVEFLAQSIALGKMDPAELASQPALRLEVGRRLAMLSGGKGRKALPELETKGGGADRNRGGAEKLRHYWTRGPGAAKIRWGEPGDWQRCVDHLSKYLGIRAKGYCNLRHKEATGMSTARHAQLTGHGKHGHKALCCDDCDAITIYQTRLTAPHLDGRGLTLSALQAKTRDGDGDGFINDGPRQQPRNATFADRMASRGSRFVAAPKPPPPKLVWKVDDEGTSTVRITAEPIKTASLQVWEDEDRGGFRWLGDAENQNPNIDGWDSSGANYPTLDAAKQASEAALLKVWNDWADQMDWSVLQDKARKPQAFDPNAHDGDHDATVQDGSKWERPAAVVVPAAPKLKPRPATKDLPSAPFVDQLNDDDTATALAVAHIAHQTGMPPDAAMRAGRAIAKANGQHLNRGTATPRFLIRPLKAEGLDQSTAAGAAAKIIGDFPNVIGAARADNRSRLSGEGFFRNADGQVRWGRYGAAGVLFRHVGDDGTVHYMLQQRSSTVQQGGTWSIPGGALSKDEPSLVGAVRETVEEVGDPGVSFHPVKAYEFRPAKDWAYTTHVVDVASMFDLKGIQGKLAHEQADVAWVKADDVAKLDLHPGFKATFDQIHAAPDTPTGQWITATTLAPPRPTPTAPKPGGTPKPRPKWGTRGWRTEPIDDAEFADRAAYYEAVTKPGSPWASGGPNDTKSLYVKDGVYTPERAALHPQLMAKAVQDALDHGVGFDRQALMLGGLPGAGKSTILGNPNVTGRVHVTADSSGEPVSHLVINADNIKEALIHAGVVPIIPGLSPAESSHLVHEESFDIAEALFAWASQNGMNVIYDGTFKSHESGARRIETLRKAGYQVHGLFVDVNAATSEEGVIGRWRRGVDRFESAGDGDGGRAVPLSLVQRTGTPPPGAPKVRSLGKRVAPKSVNRVAFDSIAEMGGFDTAIVIDNDPPYRSNGGREVASWKNGKADA